MQFMSEQDFSSLPYVGGYSGCVKGYRGIV